MRVLWLTSSPAGAAQLLNHNLPTRGWIASLGDVIKNRPGIELAVCFFNNAATESKFVYEQITYYQIKDKLASKPQKVINKLLNRIWDTNLAGVMQVVEDYKPDIIQLFGTETGLGEIVGQTKIPIIIHLQGLLNPYKANWLPRGFTASAIAFHSSLQDLVLRRDLYSEYLLLSKLAIREEKIIRKAKYFFGRTGWDRRVVTMYNNGLQYFHCEEVLRPGLYGPTWKYANTDVIRLVSTINPQIYKGLDILLETAHLLQKIIGVKLEWNILGMTGDHRVVKLIQKIKKLKFADNNVIFQGPQQGDQLLAHLLRSTLFIHPSHIDNSPNSVCEAMLLGMPVIAGNVGGISSLITNGVNGICYNSQDPYDLASIILETVEDVDKMNSLGTAARKTATERHDKDKIAAVVVGTYAHIIKEEKTRQQPSKAVSLSEK